ncbi:hypothetical protein G7013_05005 [Pseudomonas viridiflava]|uniref:hypothetical protein n=1 Tax=Pseudomonas viridiflava TaxID=33069 RepID=UPI0015E42FE5|nr:hypothetical protein [Pseudomonas viridiflava]MBA1229009.1 hypothetical protein [Pseudomonas viridiflava]
MHAPKFLFAAFASASFFVQATPATDENVECSAYFEILSVAGDQPDITRPQASKLFYVFLARAGDTPENQDAVAHKMVELSKEVPRGKMTSASIAPLRARLDAKCKALLTPSSPDASSQQRS